MSDPTPEQIAKAEAIGALAAKLADVMIAARLAAPDSAFAAGLALKGLATSMLADGDLSREDAYAVVAMQVGRALALPDEAVRVIPGQGESQVIPVKKH